MELLIKSLYANEPNKSRKRYDVEKKNLKYHNFKSDTNEKKDMYFNHVICTFVKQLLIKDHKQIIGYKLYKNKIKIATNCVFDKNYMNYVDNKKEINKYYLFYNHSKVPYFLEDVVDILAINNDDIIVKTTDKSDIIVFTQIKKK